MLKTLEKKLISAMTAEKQIDLDRKMLDTFKYRLKNMRFHCNINTILCHVLGIMMALKNVFRFEFYVKLENKSYW